MPSLQTNDNQSNNKNGKSITIDFYYISNHAYIMAIKSLRFTINLLNQISIDI